MKTQVLETIYEDKIKVTFDDFIIKFFKENQRQLEFYKSLFEGINSKFENNIVEIIRSHIKSDYIPNMKTWLSYRSIRRDKNCRGLMNSIHFFSNIESENFLYCLTVLLGELEKSHILNL
jgi:hypothetical protein